MRRTPVGAPPHDEIYSERRNLMMSSCEGTQVFPEQLGPEVGGKLWKSLITSQASPISGVQVPVGVMLGAWSTMAVKRSPARPSCRKNRRWPMPHSGAVRNWAGPASPWVTPSARDESMVWKAKSENG